jgi:O-antigen ligase
MKLNKLFDGIFFVLFAALFFITPLIMYDKTSELFEFNKLLFIYCITLLAVCTWILKCIWYKRLEFKRTILDIPILLFLASQVVSTIFSIDIHTSFFGYYGRFNGGLLSIFCYTLLYFIFVNTISVAYFNKLLTAIVSSGVVVFLWGVPSKFGHDLTCLLFTHQFNDSCWTQQFRPQDRMFSTLGQPNWLGAYFAIQFFLSLFFLMKTRDRMKQILLSIFPIIFFVGVLFTRSRSALLAVVIGLIIALIHFFITGVLRKGYREILRSFIPAFSIVAVLSFLFVLVFKTGVDKIDHYLILNKTPVSNTITHSADDPFSNVTESFDIRKIVWTGAYRLGMQYPLFGTGVETFAYAYNFVRPQEHNLTSEWDFIYNKAHNEYLNYFATTGVFGLLTYSILIGFSAYIFLSQLKRNNTKTIDDRFSLDVKVLFIFVAWTTILITNFFGFSTTVISVFFYLLPTLVLLKHDTQENISVPFSYARLSASLMPLILIIFGLSYIFNYFLADTYYATSNNYNSIEDYKSAYAYLNKAESLKPDHVYEDKLSNILANLAYVSAYDNSNTNVSEKKKELNDYYKLSEYFSSKALEGGRANVFYYKTKAKNYYLFYELTQTETFFAKGLQILGVAERLAPTDARIKYTEGVFYLAKLENITSFDQKLIDSAFAAFDTSIALKPNYRDAYLAEGLLYKKIGEKEKARQAFESLLKYYPGDLDATKEVKGL